MNGAASIDLSVPRRIHLLGIGGAGMSGIALILDGLGHVVSGSDQVASPTLERLAERGMRVVVGQTADGLGDAEIVGCSTAIRDDNPELVAARDRDLIVCHRYQLLEAIGTTRQTLSVSGTHGKTTTSAMLSVALDAAGEEPSFLVGSTLANFGVAARLAESRFLVLEGDESDSTFLAPRRRGVIVTNLEPDHLDHHGSVEALEAAFDRFVADTEGPAIVCADDPGAAALAARHTGASTYGTAPEADWKILDVTESDGATTWTVVGSSGETAGLTLATRGIHLVRNATAVFALGRELGIEPEPLIAGLASFAGTARRFESRGTCSGVQFVDDYAHLPAEVAATMATAVGGNWERIVAVVQPHRYTRTLATSDQYGAALAGADVVVVADVYAAGEDEIPGVSGELIADNVVAERPEIDVVWEPSRSQLPATLAALLQPGDLCLTLGAGDVTKVASEVQDLMGAAT